MPITLGRNFPKKHARCTMARPSIVRSMASLRPKRSRSSRKKASNFTRCRHCQTNGISAPLGARLIRPYQQRDADHHQNNSDALAWRGWLLEYESCHALCKNDLDQRQRSHIGGRRDGESEKPEFRGKSAHEAGKKRRLPSPRNGTKNAGIAQ